MEITLTKNFVIEKNRIYIFGWYSLQSGEMADEEVVFYSYNRKELDALKNELHPIAVRWEQISEKRKNDHPNESYENYRKWAVKNIKNIIPVKLKAKKYSWARSVIIDTLYAADELYFYVAGIAQWPWGEGR